LAEVSFGEWLKRRRKAQGLTQEELALQISCSASALRKIEAEQRRPSAQIVEQLAEVFNIAPSERKSFLKFARGNWDLAPTGVIESAPWLESNIHEYEISSGGEDLSNPKTHLATFLFTDIEGSTKLWESVPEKMKAALARHHEILQEAISSNRGDIFQIVGDAFCAVFPTASSAISAALTAQRALHQEQWDTPSPIRVRMGIHTGAAERTSNDSPTGGYASNHTLNRVARILSAGHGGQILLSLVTKELVKDSLPADTELRDTGEHYLKNLTRPEHLFQLNIASLPSDFPPLNTLDSDRHNLPLQLTSFIGREREIAEVKYLLSATRLLTLIGPGGTGKTRLSIQIAGELLDQYPDGAWFVEFAPISDPLLIPRTTAIAIGLRDEPQRPVIDMLCDYLRGKQLVLILDNCEHLVEACAQMADRLLRACPQIRILASSREALGIAGETSYLVPSLKLPDMQNLPSVEVLSQGEAVRLFIERASAATQKFKVTDENASSVAQICHRLDGIPLAIELAAAKIRALSVEQIAKRLDDRFRLLTGGSRTTLERHQTLRAAIDWSYNLLPSAEQVLFRRLPVFVNGWTLEAAESVCGDETASSVVRRDDVLNLLEHLINKSIVIKEEIQQETRYRMLETMRQYANEKLVESGESDALRDHHLDYFLTLAETAQPHLQSAEQVEWLKQLDAEHENLRATLDWAIGKKSAEPALRLAGALGYFWDLHSYWLEGAKWLDQALGRGWTENVKSEKAARARALYRRADLALELDELHVVKTSAESALALGKEVQDAWGIAYSRTHLALHSLRLSLPQARRKSLEQSLNEFQRLGDVWGESRVLNVLGWALVEEGTSEELRDNIQRAIARARVSGDRNIIAQSLLRLVWSVLMQFGEWQEAERVLQEVEWLYEEIDSSNGINRVRNVRVQIFFARGNLDQAKAEAKLFIEYCVRVGERNGRGEAVVVMGLIAEAENDLSNAVEYEEQALELAREMKVPALIAFSLLLIGLFKYQQGDIEAARQHVREGLEFVRRGEVGEWRFAYICCYLGGFFVEKRPRIAVQILAHSESLWQSFPVPRDPIFDKPYFDRFLAAARAKLSEAEFTSAWEVGLKMTMKEAIELAFKTLEEM